MNNIDTGDIDAVTEVRRENNNHRFPQNELSLDDVVKLLDESDEPVKENQNHELYPQHPFRWLVAGKSGSGKTTILLHAIFTQKIKFSKLYLYARHLDEPKYVNLMKYLNTIARENDVPLSELLVVGDKPEDIVAVDSLDEEEQNLVLFDDFIGEKQANQGIITDYFTRGRHKNASCIYVSQSFFKVPKMIRDNCNYFSLYAIGNHATIRDIALELSLDKSSNEVVQLFKAATADRHSFLFVDQKTLKDELRYRKNFDEVQG